MTVSAEQNNHKAIASPPPRVRVLLEMRPALEGFAGIPQENRLLFRGLNLLPSVEVEGMLQTSTKRLATGITAKAEKAIAPERRAAWRFDRLSRVIVSIAHRDDRSRLDRLGDKFKESLEIRLLALRLLFVGKRIKLSRFDASDFRDFIWRSLFAKTLPPSDREAVTNATQRICTEPWHVMQMAGLKVQSIIGRARYPRLDTQGIDVFIAQTPYPGRPAAGTAFVVRYHDAIPVLMPHTIPNKQVHRATHFHALRDNVRAGAWFACVSESARQDLIRIFPQAEERSVTIHNMVSHHYFVEDSVPELVPQIIRARLYSKVPDLVPKFLTIKERETFYRQKLEPASGLRYLLIVSTVEPRKNHARLLAAWEAIRASVDPDLKLVVVGTLGWAYGELLPRFKAWVERGDLLSLNAVPAGDLRVLYRHAALTVCPSLAEGFDFSGVESMASGGVVASSDIPVHREVYGDASAYFDPYSTGALIATIRRLVYENEAVAKRNLLQQAARAILPRYLPQNILPQWDAFLQRVAGQRSQA